VYEEFLNKHIRVNFNVEDRKYNFEGILTDIEESYISNSIFSLGTSVTLITLEEHPNALYARTTFPAATFGPFGMPQRYILDSRCINSIEICTYDKPKALIPQITAEEFLRDVLPEEFYE
jgi:hypothetical protein